MKIEASECAKLAEYTALTTRVGVVDLSSRTRVCLVGADRNRFLNGQVTNNVKALHPWTGCYAALVNAKAKLETDLNILCLPDELLLDCEPGLAQTLITRFDRFIIADDVQTLDAAPHFALFSLRGPLAADVAARYFPDAAPNLPDKEYACLSASLPLLPVDLPVPLTRALASATSTSASGPETTTSTATATTSPSPSPDPDASDATPPQASQVYLARVPRFGLPGLDVFVPVAHQERVWNDLLRIAVSCGGSAVGFAATELARLEAGIPRFGADMDGTNLAPEAGIEGRAISYSKGCYIGQEIISRLRAYGQVAKRLSGLVLPDGLNSDSDSLPPRGAKLFYGQGSERKEVGFVTTAFRSPKFGKNLALAYVRKEVPADASLSLQLELEGGAMTVRRTSLPFGNPLPAVGVS